MTRYQEVRWFHEKTWKNDKIYQEVDNMSKLAILVVVLLGLAYFIDAREERLFFGRRQVCNF